MTAWSPTAGRALSCPVHENEEGLHVATFQPDETGEWSIAITHQGAHIQGGPFTCFVFDPHGIKLVNLQQQQQQQDVILPGRSYSFGVDASGTGGLGDIDIDIVHEKQSVAHFVQEHPGSKLIHVSFVPRTPGKYRIYVYFNGSDVRGSPFLLRVGRRSKCQLDPADNSATNTATSTMDKQQQRRGLNSSSSSPASPSPAAVGGGAGASPSPSPTLTNYHRFNSPNHHQRQRQRQRTASPSLIPKSDEDNEDESSSFLNKTSESRSRQQSKLSSWSGGNGYHHSGSTAGSPSRSPMNFSSGTFNKGSGGVPIKTDGNGHSSATNDQYGSLRWRNRGGVGGTTNHDNNNAGYNDRVDTSSNVRGFENSLLFYS